jgi:hypothetical protein
VHKKNGRSGAGSPLLDGKLHPVDCKLFHRFAGGAGLEEISDVGGYRNRAALPIDAYEHKLGCRYQGVVGRPPCSLAQRETGVTEVDQGVLNPESVARKGRSEVVNDSLPNRRPGPGLLENVHTGSPGEHVPPGSLEYPKEGRLIEVTEGVAIVGVNDVLDFARVHVESYV